MCPGSCPQEVFVEVQKYYRGSARLRKAEDSAWVYEYDAWTVPLADADTIAA